jgi:hypothetical protein
MADYSNLPKADPGQSRSNSDSTVKYFDAYGKLPLEFSATDSDAVIGFFMKRGMEEAAAKTTALIVLKQAKIDGVNVFELLNEIKDFTAVQLSDVLGEILNVNRIKTSALGTAKPAESNSIAQRNILA